jgi:pyruvate dehydrogenase E1 component beta subunit
LESFLQIGDEMPKWRMRQAIAEAIGAEMAADDAVVLIGEDVGDAEGVFKTSEGLMARFGAARVRDTPIAEMGFTGLAVGAAAMGVRPVVEIMFAEFAGVALDQIATEAAKLRYLSQGQFGVPIVVRMSAGPGLGFGAQHSQTLETWFRNTPGLKVVTPSGPESAYWLLREAIRDDDPIVFLEPRVLYGDRSDVDDQNNPGYRIGVARIARKGGSATVVAAGQTVTTALAAAEQSGLDVEVIDLGTIAPWDIETVTESVRRTTRLVTVEANPYSGGWGADIVAEVAARCHGELSAPPLRIACPDVPVPYSAVLERAYLPDAGTVADRIQLLMTTNRAEPAWWEGVPA